MAQVPSQLRSAPSAVMRRIEHGCQHRMLVKADGPPLLVIEPLQFVPLRRKAGRWVASR